MHNPVSQRSFLTELQAWLNQPAALVCVALVIALLTVAARIAAVW